MVSVSELDEVEQTLRNIVPEKATVAADVDEPPGASPLLVVFVHDIERADAFLAFVTKIR